MAISIGTHGIRIPKPGFQFGSDGPEVLFPPGFVIDITGTLQQILNRVGDPIGTIAFATDTNDLMILNTGGFDKWGSVEDIA